MCIGLRGRSGKLFRRVAGRALRSFADKFTLSGYTASTNIKSLQSIHRQLDVQIKNTTSLNLSRINTHTFPTQKSKFALAKYIVIFHASWGEFRFLRVEKVLPNDFYVLRKQCTSNATLLDVLFHFLICFFLHMTDILLLHCVLP